jgi:outer membrane protein assembly complex protein YaeT
MPRLEKGFKALLPALLLAAATGFSAGKPVEDPLPIGIVLVQVDGVAAGPEIAALIPISSGEPYSLKKIDSTIKQVYKTGLFSDVQVLKEGQAEVQLTFLLTRKLITRKVAFRGEKGLSQRTLRDSLYSIRPEGFYSEDRMSRAEAELVEALKKEGYLKAKVKAQAGRDPDQPFMDVVFETSPGFRYTIQSIEFPGEPLVAISDLKKKIVSREGQPYIPRLVDEDLIRLKDYFLTAGYPRAGVTLADPVFHEESQSVGLSIKVVPNERIIITIKGAKVAEGLVRPIWEEEIFEEWGLLQSEAKVLSTLRSEGYVFASAKSSIEKAPNEIHVIHEINTGKKYRIFGPAFEGLHYFTPTQIKAELGIGPDIPFLGGVAGEKVFGMPQQIDHLYESKGFKDTQVDLNFKLIDGYMTAVFNIEEGAQQKIDRVSLNGASLFNPQTLLSQMTSAGGGPYFQPDVRKDIERLENYYLNQGVRGTKVSARMEKTGPNLFAVSFDIQEGRKVRIEKIAITGNVVTRKNTILREFRIREEDWAYADKILETKRNLEKLGVFSEVKLEEIAVSEDAENIIINLREGERNYISLGVGLETKRAPQSAEIWKNELSPRGTVEFIRSNIFGTASQLSLVTQFSLKEKRGVVSWEQPYFFGFSVQTALNAWLEREERVSYGFDQRGTSFTGIKSLGKGWVSLTTLRWVRTTLYFLEIAESEVDRQFFPFSTTSLSQSLIRDRRDDTFNPERGSFLSVVAEWAYPLFKVESDYFKSFVKYQQFFPVFTRMNFSLTARFGLGMGRMPIHERFFGGGSNSFRGQSFDRLGPLDQNSQMPVGGKALLIVNFELRFPLFSSLPNLSGAVFYDKGNIFYRRSDFRLGQLEDALGLGIRYRTPLGPIRLDFGWNLNPPQGRAQPLVFITIGNIF